MARRVLDTNYLISHWGNCLRGNRIAEQNPQSVKRWARQLIKNCGTDAILTPVYIEFIVGLRSEYEVRLAQAYLGEFVVADSGKITDDDWAEARRIAARVPRDGRRRQLGDCLIRAICNRLRYEILTADTGFPR
jgi:predicted nucleic acid-binding protein